MAVTKKNGKISMIFFVNVEFMISRKATTQPIPVYPVDVVLPFFIWVVLEFSKLYLFADFDTFTIYFTCWVTGARYNSLTKFTSNNY